MECDDQSNGGYNCIRSCHLSRSKLRVELSQQLGSVVDVQGFDIGLLLDEPSHEALKAGLARVFRGMSGALEIG